MNVVYNSDSYYVVEYAGEQRGYELVHKHTRKSTFFHGDVAEKFAESINSALAEDASPDNIDDFLGNFDILMTQPVVLH